MTGIMGRFQKVSENPLVIGLLGKVNKKGLSAGNIEYIKSFYNSSGKTHRFVKDYPVKINRSLYNEFMVVE